MALQSAVILLGILLALPYSARSVDTGRRPARPPRSPSSVESKNCTEISHVFEGPYWVDENIETSNVRLNVSYGVPLNITFKLVNGTLSEQLGACAGIENARIDLWQCRYDGLYSDEVAQTTEGETWLRGYQFTNSTGHASFQTIYPGWYRWRTVHIHLRVRVYGDLDKTITIYEDTTQLYFDDNISESIFIHVYPYNNRGLPDTTNMNDLFFKSTNLITLKGSYLDANGYSGLVELILPFYPFTFLEDPKEGKHGIIKGPLISIV